MGYYNSTVRISLEASADLSSHQYKFATLGATGVALNTTAGGPCIGVIDTNDADALGKRVPVAIGNVTKVKLGGTVTRGNNIQSDGAGLGIVAATADYSQGIALESGVTGDIIPILLRPQAQLN